MAVLWNTDSLPFGVKRAKCPEGGVRNG